MPTETENFQKRVESKIRDSLRNFDLLVSVPVEAEWRALREQISDVRKARYSPRTDVAVGPFAVGDLRLENDYDVLMEHFGGKIDSLNQAYRENASGTGLRIPNGWRDINSVNRNARCFMAFEIEKTGTMKHRLGDIVNAAALGRVGVVIAMDNGVLRSFLRIAMYFGFLKSKAHI